MGEKIILETRKSNCFCWVFYEKRKTSTFLLGIQFFPRSRFIEEGAFVPWLPFYDLSIFQGKISQFPPSIGNTHRRQERVLPNRLLSNSWPLHGFIN